LVAFYPLGKGKIMPSDNQDLVALLADESFQHWVTGSASEAENQQWAAWLEAAPERAELLAQAKELWKAAQFKPPALPDAEVEWQKLQARLHTPLTTSASVRRLSTTELERRRWFSWPRFGAVAAAALLLLALLARYFPFSQQPDQSKQKTTATRYGERTRLELPEGITIILNANSTLHYPAAWTKATEKRVELRGEAYFEVSPQVGQQHDFMVQTNDGTVKVAGTRFVVYERGQGTAVAVEEGKVAVMAAEDRTGRDAYALLQPGQLVQFRKHDLTLSPQFVSLDFYTTWWQDHFKFEGTPFVQIARRLEETYGVRVQMNDERLQQRQLTGAIENGDLEVILVALAKALGTTVRHEGDLVIFGKQ
jgi:ferric-dicitrate binding protein FerR (iron transport regulator)